MVKEVDDANFNDKNCDQTVRETQYLKKLYNDKNCEHQFLVKVIKEAKPNDKNGGPKHGKDIKEEQTGY